MPPPDRAAVLPAPPPPPPLTPAGRRAEPPAWLNGIFAAICLYLFLGAINTMGGGLKAVGKNTDLLENLLAHAQNPFVALMGSVLVTAIVQSSSFTTSLIITLVAAGQMEPQGAVYAVMGANIGTSVTSIIVSFGNVRIRRQFRRAFTAALVHDIFNWLTVAMLFPLEWITSALSADGRGVLSRIAYWLAGILGSSEIEKPSSIVKTITGPVGDAVEWLVSVVSDTPIVQGWLVTALGLVLLFISLALMVKNLKGALLRYIEGWFRRVFFRNDLLAYIVGTLTTVFVQSSSVSTSLIVPLAGAGAVKIKRVFPFMLGANLGTTLTGVIAASAAGALNIALAHVLFNAIGTAVWYPLRSVPLRIARWYGKVAATSKRYAFLFLLMVFVVIPLIGLIITELILRLTGGNN